MCTTGVLRFADGSYALFKNKDFGRAHLDDRIWLDADVFGVLGMTTWAGDDPASDEYSGFSIGANRDGLLCCDSNVVTLDGLVNYDVMTEVALRHGTDVASAADAVRAACVSAPTSWGNLVLIDATSAASIEIRGQEVAVVPLEGPTARTNHHVVLGHHELQEDHVTTDLRLASAQRRIATAEALGDVYRVAGVARRRWHRRVQPPRVAHHGLQLRVELPCGTDHPARGAGAAVFGWRTRGARHPVR